MFSILLIYAEGSRSCPVTQRVWVYDVVGEEYDAFVSPLEITFHWKQCAQQRFSLFIENHARNIDFHFSLKTIRSTRIFTFYWKPRAQQRFLSFPFGWKPSQRFSLPVAQSHPFMLRGLSVHPIVLNVWKLTSGKALMHTEETSRFTTHANGTHRFTTRADGMDGWTP